MPTTCSIRSSFVLILLALAAVPIARGAEARPEVALTFDDLPVHGELPPGLRRSDVAKSILETLRARKAPPVYGFVNAKGLAGDPDHVQVLKLWRSAGHPLGNHTFSHIDLHQSSVEAFSRDVVASEASLVEHMPGQDWRWLRYPFLHEGDTIEKRRAVRAFLKDRGYRVADVTISFDDYAYNGPYARCLARNDTKSLEWLKENYLTRAAESITLGQTMAKLAFGRDVKHVMLLHVGAFQTVMLGPLLDLLDKRGFKLVTLQEAQGDPAYSADPDEPTQSGETFLQRMITARKRPPPAYPAGPFSALFALCN